MFNRVVAILLCVTACGSPNDFAGFAAAEPSNTESLTSNYFPALGKGVNLAETKTYGVCVAFSEPPPNPATFEQRSFDVFNIKTRLELNEKLNVSASAAAKGMWGSASAKYAREQV